VKGIGITKDAQGVKLGFGGSKILDCKNTPFLPMPIRQFAPGGLVRAWSK
jgi:hypothetical protein